MVEVERFLVLLSQFPLRQFFKSVNHIDWLIEVASCSWSFENVKFQQSCIVPSTINWIVLLKGAWRWGITIWSNVLYLDFDPIFFSLFFICFNLTSGWVRKDFYIACENRIYHLSRPLGHLSFSLVFGILFVVLSFFQLHFNFSKIKLIFVILGEYNLKHIIEQFFFFSRLWYRWAWLKIRGLVDFVQLCWLNNISSDRD